MIKTKNEVAAEVGQVSHRELTLQVRVLVPFRGISNNFREAQVTVWKQEVASLSEAADIAGQVRYANSNGSSIGGAKIFGVYTERTEV